MGGRHLFKQRQAHYYLHSTVAHDRRASPLLHLLDEYTHQWPIKVLPNASASDRFCPRCPQTIPSRPWVFLTIQILFKHVTTAANQNFCHLFFFHWKPCSQFQSVLSSQRPIT